MEIDAALTRRNYSLIQHIAKNKNKLGVHMNPPVKLLDLVRQRLRLKGYTIRTEKSYTEWILRYNLFHGKQHPKEMGKGR
jgi:hypothetical protein